MRHPAYDSESRFWQLISKLCFWPLFTIFSDSGIRTFSPGYGFSMGEIGISYTENFFINSLFYRKKVRFLGRVKVTLSGNIFRLTYFCIIIKLWVFLRSIKYNVFGKEKRLWFLVNQSVASSQSGSRISVKPLPFLFGTKFEVLEKWFILGLATKKVG